MTVRNLTGTDHPVVEATGDWAALSARMTQAVDADLLSKQGRGGNAWAGRDDVIVSIAPGAGQEAPACFMPGLARIEIDGKLLEVPPEHFDPSDGMDREDCAATWGLLTHEAAHVRFSTWIEDMDTALRQAIADKTMTAQEAAQIQETAMLLEEPRIEAQQKRVRPGDERWLRCSAARHLMDDIIKKGTPDVDSALTTLALVGGRQQHGIIVPTEGNKVLQAARTIVNDAPSRPDDKNRYGSDYISSDWSNAAGASRSARLLWVVQQATAQQAPTAETMITLAKKWISYLPDNAGQPGPGAAAALADALKDMTDEIDEGGGWIPTEEDEDNSPAKYKPHSWTPATPAQKRAASLLADALKGYLIPERTSRRVPSLLPPGKLKTRIAMTADAQEARGLIPDATPWRRISHRVNPTPPLRVGIAVDVSGSMSSVARHTWEIVYRMYNAFDQLPDCEVQVYLAGVGTARAKLKPGSVPSYSYSHGCERVDLAIGKLRKALSLTRRGWARLLIVVSDAGFTTTEYRGSVRECSELIKSGCRVLWLDHSAGHGYRGSGDAVTEVVKAGGHFKALSGTPEDAAKMAEAELVRVVHDAALELRRAR